MARLESLETRHDFARFRGMGAMEAALRDQQREICERVEAFEAWTTFECNHRLGTKARELREGIDHAKSSRVILGVAYRQV